MPAGGRDVDVAGTKSGAVLGLRSFQRSRPFENGGQHAADAVGEMHGHEHGRPESARQALDEPLKEANSTGGRADHHDVESGHGSLQHDPCASLSAFPGL